MTKEEIIAVLDNPETANLVLDTLKERQFNVLKPEEHTKFINDERDRVRGTITSEIYGGLDKDIMEVSGLKKNPEEKTYDFAKRVIGSFKEGKTSYETKIAELENKIKEGSQDKTLVAQIEALQQKQDEYEKEKQTLQSSLFQKDVNIEINEALREFKFKSDLPQSLVKTHLGVIKNQLLSSAKFENGKYTFYGEDGKVILDDKAQVASAAYILKDRLKDVIDAGRQQQGAGSGQNQPTGTGTFARITGVPAGIEKQGQLIDHMLSNGYIKNSKEYNEDFGKFSQGLKLR